MINKQIRQPIGIRIESKSLEHFHFYSAQANVAIRLFRRKKGAPAFVLLYTPKVKTFKRGLALKLQMLHEPLNGCK
jgi:hypothetical protein